MIGLLGLVLMAGSLVGLVVRGRHHAWRFFFLYLLAVLVLGSIPHVAPLYYTPELYQAKEMAYAFLRFAMACEVGLRIFRSFPGALATARRLALLVLAGTLAAILTTRHEGYESFVGELQPRILNGSVWLFTGLAVLILWYRLPLRPFYKSIVLSYVPYLLVFTVLTSALVSRGWERGGLIQLANQLAYVALLAFWNIVIWRKDPPTPGPPSPEPPLLAGPA